MLTTSLALAFNQATSISMSKWPMLQADKFNRQSSSRYDCTILANDGVFGHGIKVLGSDDIPASSRGDKDVGSMSSFFHGSDLVAGHSSLQSVDRVNFGDNDTSTVRSEGLCALAKDIR